jgi:hypothetical protein
VQRKGPGTGTRERTQAEGARLAERGRSRRRMAGTSSRSPSETRVYISAVKSGNMEDTPITQNHQDSSVGRAPGSYDDTRGSQDRDLLLIHFFCLRQDRTLFLSLCSRVVLSIACMSTIRHPADAST